MASENTLTQFDYLYDALANKYPGLVASDGSQVFQFAVAPIGASWVTGNDANAYGIANSVSPSLGGFYSLGNPLDNAYSSLITSIQPTNYSANPAYTAQQTILTGLDSSYQQTLHDAQAAYQVWAAENPGPNGTASETFSAWVVDPFGGAGWGMKISQLQTQINNTTAKLAAIVKAMDAALANAQAALGTDMMPISNNGGTTSVPAVTIGGNIGNDVARWASYPAGQYDFQVQFDKDYTVTSPWKTVYSTTVSHDCWYTNVETSVNTSRIITDEHYSLEVSAVGLEGYPINRGSWWHGEYVRPDVKLAPGTSVTTDTFFGPNGSLHLIPELVLVMFRPTFKVTVSTDVYQQQFGGNASADIDWINVFGFQFAFDGLASLEPVAGANNTTTVTFKAPEGASPQILGVVSKVVWDGSTSGATDLDVASLRAPAKSGGRPGGTSPSPAPAAEAARVAPVQARLQPQQHVTFQAFPEPRLIELTRVHPLGPASFVVFRNDDHRSLGAGSCPALSARPPFATVLIPPGVDFTVQNVSPTVAIDVGY